MNKANADLGKNEITILIKNHRVCVERKECNGTDILLGLLSIVDSKRKFRVLKSLGMMVVRLVVWSKTRNLLRLVVM